MQPTDWPLPHGRRARAAIVRRVVALGALFASVAVFGVPAAVAAPMSSSQQVGLIPSNAPAGSTGRLPDGVMPISSYVTGRPNLSFDKFTFKSLGLSNITSAALAGLDTVALIQVRTVDLSPTAKTALAQFVANGGKLIIHDSDETSLNDYSWLLPGSYSTKDGAGCNACGSTSGVSKITENTGLISANPGDPAYVNLADLPKYSDAVGDANLLVSDDPRWFAAASGSNAANEAGAQIAYASNNGGLIIFNGYDTDFIKAVASDPFRCLHSPNGLCPANSQPSVDWLAEMWYFELNKSWGAASQSGSNGLPQTKPVNSIGTTLAPGASGLPSNRACVAKGKLFLRLQNLAGHKRNVVQVDVYVNGRHVLREKGRPHNVTLTRLPRKGNMIIKVVATTKRRYHLISKTGYHAC